MKKIEKKRAKAKNICCIGAGYVGGPTMAVIADNCPEINITIVDKNVERINLWNDDDLSKLPVFEPGLEEIIRRVRNKNLFFSIDLEAKIKEADIVFLSVNTPTKIKGLGSGKASDLTWIEACARQVAEAAEGHTIVVEKSTIPVRTAETVKKILECNNKNNSFSVLSNPEFLAEGTAINDLQQPDRILIGGEDVVAIELLSDIYKNWVDESKILKTNIWSSELSKLIANAFLAQRVSSINSVSAICEVTGANIKEVSKAVGFDSRIGDKFLSPGPGFGGSCFKKDILNLIYLCSYYGLNQVAEYWEHVININTWQQERIYRTVVEKLFGTVYKKKIIILGFSFKADTNDTRESSSISISRNLINEGAHLLIHDPKVSPSQITKDLELEPLTENLNSIEDNNNGSWEYITNLEDSFTKVDAVIILTDWKIYRKLNWEKISFQMRHPAWIFDTRLILDKNKVISSSLNYWGLGIG